jgi:hypothetical protein
MIAGIADPILLTIRPKPDEPALTTGQVSDLVRTAHAESFDLDADGTARFGFDGERYDAASARGNLEMAARMQLGSRWHTRYEVS